MVLLPSFTLSLYFPFSLCLCSLSCSNHQSNSSSYHHKSCCHLNSSMKKRWCWSIEEDGSWDNEELNESFFLEDSDDDTSANITSKTAMPNQKINLGKEYKCPLYPGSQICILMTYLLIFQFSIQHSLTESALKELLLLISVLLPVQASFPKSVWKLKHFFLKYFQNWCDFSKLLQLMP